MSHKPVTQNRPIPMPRQSYLLERNGQFYLNLRVPKDLRPVYGKKELIRKSLGTSDRREAISRVRYEAFKLDSEFEEKRRELKGAEPPPTVLTINDREAHDLVFRWLIHQEKLSQDWWDKEGSKFDETDTELALDNLRIDETVYSGGNKNYRAEDGSGDLDAFLKAEGLQCPKGSPAYQKLLSLFTKARLENVRRNIARVTHQTVLPREPLFHDVFAHTALPPTRSVTVGKMVERFLKCLTEAKRTEKTLLTYAVPCRLLREVLGENTPVGSITKEHMEQLFSLLRNSPSNVTKRYRGLTLKQAIEAADKNHDSRRLAGKTLENYFINIVAIFNFAVDEGWIAKNPVKGRLLRASFEGGDSPKPRVLFTIDELNRLFRAPLFTRKGNEPSGRQSPKIKILREGQAWVPLLALFHGFRCNEVAQLYTEDVKSEDGIPFIEIREEREDGAKSDKRIKTKQSKRRVPVHPEILKMGFLSFVAQREKDDSSPRLFPDLPLGATGYFSDPLSKWFSRFVKKTLGNQCKGTFHSLRHQFRDALREAGVSTEDAERLGGWELMKHSAEREYGRGPSLKRLRDQIQKVKFPNLDLKHLYAS